MQPSMAADTTRQADSRDAWNEGMVANVTATIATMLMTSESVKRQR
jgi:hypothetical protein